MKETALIIGGFPRSGTSLLRRICTRHPEITVTGELGNFLQLGASYERHLLSLLQRWRERASRKDPILVMRGQSSRWHHFRNNHAFVIRYLLTLHQYRQSPVTVSVIDKTLRTLFPEVRIVGDKFPNYVFFLDSLVGVDGLSRVIIYRDCRDVASSYLKMARTIWRHKSYGKNMNEAGKIAVQWVEAIEMMERYADQLHLIRYEELMQFPDRVLSALGDYLGVDAKDFPRKRIRSTSIGKYEQGLTPAELEIVMEIAGPTLRRLNYHV